MASSISTPSRQKVSEPLMPAVREWFLGHKDTESFLRPHLLNLCTNTINLKTLLTALYSKGHIELESLQKFERETPYECYRSLYLQLFQKKSHLNILLTAWEGSGNHHLVRALYNEICGVDISAKNPGGAGGTEESVLQQFGSKICQQGDLEQPRSDHSNTTEGRDSVNSRATEHPEIIPLMVQKENKKNQKRFFQWLRRRCSFRVVVFALLVLVAACIALMGYIIHIHTNTTGSTSTEQPDGGATWSNLPWMTPMPTVPRVTITTPVTSSIPPEVTRTLTTTGVTMTPVTSSSSSRVTEVSMEQKVAVAPVTSSSTPDVTQMPDRLGMTPTTFPPSTQAQETDIATEAELTMADTTSVTVDPSNSANVDSTWTTHPTLPTTLTDSGPLVIMTTKQLLKLRADDVQTNTVLVQLKYPQVSNFSTPFNSKTDEKIGRVQNLYFTGPISEPLLEYLHQKFYRVHSFVIDVVPLCNSRSKLLVRNDRMSHEKNFENMETLSMVRYLGLSRCRPCEAYSMLLGWRIDQLEHLELLHCNLTADVWGPVYRFLGRHNDVLRNLTLCKSSLCDSCTFSDIPFHHKVVYRLTDSC